MSSVDLVTEKCVILGNFAELDIAIVLAAYSWQCMFSALGKKSTGDKKNHT
jgi:hypothetical protein